MSSIGIVKAEAEKRMCPFMQASTEKVDKTTTAIYNKNCKTSFCMAWTYINLKDGEELDENSKGYCLLIGMYSGPKVKKYIEN
ncbi:MAG: hypothetical protein DRG78_06295 [Epsilonproteobacteria bacterium]|nr:MAG: hypothetical protein DRG78_06295 [Campylobacterota bacterium]